MGACTYTLEPLRNMERQTQVVADSVKPSLSGGYGLWAADPCR